MIEDEPVCPECKAGVLYECVACSSNNYPPQRTEQEPFCFFYVENGEEYFAPKGAYVPDNAQPLYTTPPQRTWVGLTDEEIKTICSENGWDSSWQSLRFARAIEAKLKEKNS